MFSPERTPPLESSSNSEDDTDFPTIDIKTPEKLPKLDNEQTAPTKCSNTPSMQGHVGSPSNTSPAVCSSSTLPQVPSVGAKSEMPSHLLGDKFKSTKPPTKSTGRAISFSEADELKHLSPVNVARYKETYENKKTARKVKKLTKTLREKSDLEKKASPKWLSHQLEKIRSLSGIQGIARSEEESTFQQESAEDASNSGSVSDVNNPTQYGSHSTLPVDGGTDGTLTNPGKAIFIHPPYLITELYPPGIVVQERGLLGDILTNGSVEDLKNVLCGQLLPLAYVGKPCPVELSQWLFQLMGCSLDPEISSAALRSLVGLLQYARRQEKVSFSLPSVDEVTDVLVSLGADREKLRPLIMGGDQVQAMPVDQKREVPFVHPPSTNLLNVISYLSACIRMFPNYTVQQLEDMVLILSSLSLDHHCRHFLKLNLKTCIHYILAAYPDSVWPKAVKRLSPQLCCLSQHHQDRLLLARLISGSMPRERYLLKDFCRQCLTQMVELSSTRLPTETSLTNTDGMENYSSKEKNMDMHTIQDSTSNSCDGELPTTSSEVTKTQGPLHSDPMEVSDYMFFTKVLKSYQKEIHGETTNEEYYKMHSLLHLLQLYAPVSDLTFPSEPVKQEFIDMLGTLRANIRDDIMRPITSTVKDILIRMKLELESQSVGREKRQTNLFSFSS